MKNQYLIALPHFREVKGFNHQTILIAAKSEREAIILARYLRPDANIGEVKRVDY